MPAVVEGQQSCADGRGGTPGVAGDRGGKSGAGAAARPQASWWRRVLSAAGGALEVIFPRVCVHCHGLVADGSEYRHLCPRCARNLVLVGPPHCETCGYPFFGRMEENAGCVHCAELRPVFREGRTAALLQGPLRNLVHVLKYEKGLHVLDDLTRIVQANAHFRAFLAGAVLVPVPLHPRKRRERGYNQAELVAGCFASAVPGVVVKPLLRRRLDTPSQTRLDRSARAANLKNAFALAGRARVEGADRYVLVDDVFTTGATLNACASVLRRAGLNHVDVATLGHG